MSEPFPQRVTRVSFVLFDRPTWGRQEVTVEEARSGFGLDPPHWRICHGTSLWSKKIAQFILPHGEKQWADIRYATAEDALAEAPRACAVALKRYAKQVACYDAEQAREGKTS